MSFPKYVTVILNNVSFPSLYLPSEYLHIQYSCLYIPHKIEIMFTGPFCKSQYHFYQISLPPLKLLPFPLFLLRKETISSANLKTSVFYITVGCSHQAPKNHPANCFFPLHLLDKAVSKKSKTKKFLCLDECNLKGGGMKEKKPNKQVIQR